LNLVLEKSDVVVISVFGFEKSEELELDIIEFEVEESSIMSVEFMKVAGLCAHFCCKCS